MEFATIMMDWLFCSTTLLWRGFYERINSLLIPASLKKYSKPLEVYSLSLSNLKAFMIPFLVLHMIHELLKPAKYLILCL